MYTSGDEFKVSLEILNEEDGLFECYIPELNQTLYLTEDELNNCEQV